MQSGYQFSPSATVHDCIATLSAEITYPAHFYWVFGLRDAECLVLGNGSVGEMDGSNIGKALFGS